MSTLTLVLLLTSAGLSLVAAGINIWVGWKLRQLRRQRRITTGGGEDAGT